ncbi:MAG: glycosyltransferase family 2 protein [Dyadobacter sp.]|uniref:glycosyltransferase family 2 protein n=1 Tax=Dyadobacter sp. TaxID=1914288 RepID=UPI001B12F72A|nr:glycosyltransferase family 2 protein [Dyadobacter sp.]MBO9616379.1 glycosyltransferase family 2 protein [Dyadobacter sp.]
MHTNPLICIIILNWNGYQVTKDCIESLDNITYTNYKLILVDNGSADGSVESLKRDFPNHPHLDILPLDKNYGFTGGNNKGILYAKEKYAPEYYLLLNNDTTVDPTFLNVMQQQFAANPRCFAVVPKIFYYDRPQVLWYAGGGISRLTGVVEHYGINKTDSPKFNDSKSIDFMNGCSALISARAIEEIGILDERFFANSEDADYSLRILKSGHQIIYAADAIVYHKVSYSFKSNKGKWFTFYMATRNLILLQKKHLPLIMLPVFYSAFAMRWMFYLTLKLTYLKDSRSLKGIYLGFIDGSLNRKNIRTSL